MADLSAAEARAITTARNNESIKAEALEQMHQFVFRLIRNAADDSKTKIALDKSMSFEFIPNDVNGEPVPARKRLLSIGDFNTQALKTFLEGLGYTCNIRQASNDMIVSW